jgi:hypothetical protein
MIAIDDGSVLGAGEWSSGRAGSESGASGRIPDADSICLHIDTPDVATYDG